MGEIMRYDVICRVDEWIEMNKWCNATFGSVADVWNTRPAVRWSDIIYSFRKESDLVLFKLRWL